jgi:hypothetical protein
VSASEAPPDGAVGGAVLATAIVALGFTAGFIAVIAALRRRIRRR